MALLFANGVAEWWRAAVSGVECGRAEVLGAYLSTCVFRPRPPPPAPAFLCISCNDVPAATFPTLVSAPRGRRSSASPVVLLQGSCALLQTLERFQHIPACLFVEGCPIRGRIKTKINSGEVFCIQAMISAELRRFMSEAGVKDRKKVTFCSES